MKAVDILVKNDAYQLLEVLRTNRNKRHHRGVFLVEGVRNINQAALCGWRFEAFLSATEGTLSGWAREKLATVPAGAHFRLAGGLMAELSGKDEPSELMAVVAMREAGLAALALGDLPLLALFDRPSNKGNLGSVLRSCDALGVGGLILTGHGVDPYDPEVIGASMGSLFRVPFAHASSFEEFSAWVDQLKLRYPGFAVVGTSAHAVHAIDAIDLTRPALLLLGNETDGLSRRLIDWCDHLATIPMDPSGGATSLNVACAATALFYEAGRQRRAKEAD